MSISQFLADPGKCIKPRISLLFSCALWICLWPATVKPIQAQGPLYEAFTRFSADTALKHASWSFCAWDLSRDIPLIMHESQRGLIPASLAKLLVTSYVLQVLGPDFQYITRLQHDGDISPDGTLTGNLFIRGSGDPSFASPVFHDSLSLSSVTDKIISRLKASGITRIDGHILADESVFEWEQIPPKWLWEDLGYYYGAGASGLSVNNNEFDIFFASPRAEGLPVRIIRTEPEVHSLQLINMARGGKPGENTGIVVNGAPLDPKRYISGTVKPGQESFRIRASLPDPPGFFAESLHKALISAGIHVSGSFYSHHSARLAALDLSKRRYDLLEMKSPALSELIREVNSKSNNSFAENLLKTAAYYNHGKGSRSLGLVDLMHYLSASGIDTGGMLLHDGSGLAPTTRVTAAQITELLKQMYRHEYAQSWINSLAVAAQSGTLEHQFRSGNSAGRLRAKTGSMQGVRAYAGYSQLQDGSPVCFVLIVNHFQDSPAGIRQKITHLLDQFPVQFPPGSITPSPGD